MDKRFAYLILVGLAIGALMGMGVGAANGNAQLGIGGGAFLVSGKVWGPGRLPSAARAEAPVRSQSSRSYHPRRRRGG